MFVPNYSSMRNLSPANSYLFAQGSPTSPQFNDRYSSQNPRDSNIYFKSNEPVNSSYFPEQSNIVQQKSYFSKPNTNIKHTTSPKKDQDISITYKIIYIDGSIYYGEIKDQMRHGKGTLYNSDNHLIYIGEWKDDKYHGLGILNKGNIRYKGYFQEGLVNGEAIEESKTFKFYGFFKNGKRNGPGSLYNRNQVTQGFWKDNLIQDVC
ncbi:unnamed protein product [Paramecium pentaurelia]|uniref:MORN repeat protein n=1 Tax=Paramecium pentaurelia TaxID=43138 RepID=A0A8S1W3W4_9CILI|nr:unnamed protein product [Paramecium pentaurelia]